MLPFVHVPSVELGPVAIHPFGVLVATAVWVGTSLATWRARVLGVDAQQLRSFVGWMLVAGFIGGHVIDLLLYSPRDVIADPSSLLFLWRSQGSFGGFMGAMLGVLWWKHKTHEPILPYADLVLSVFPVAWIFGRAGCALAHDHPGIPVDAGTPLAVAYGRYDASAATIFPLGIELRWGNEPRWDLGALEMFFAMLVAGCFAATWHKRLPLGAYVAATCVAYAPVRFAMEFLRVADARYSSLTPAQWACFPLFLFGLWLARELRGRTRPSFTS
ncbi:MAG: prolipoprotein diacylglyceryl transferase [Polyangiaceae bacterium]|nr:prolipoprotein diacylglyceryl transferase [Polyangiaceae bacterium]